MKKRILVVAAHPDDEILGCGGTIARLTKAGDKCSVLILGEGITSRDRERNRNKRAAEIKLLKERAIMANAIVGVKDVFIDDLPDNRFDTVPFLDVVKKIERIIEKVNPDTIYTHFRDDLNIDHRIIYKAVLTACRPVINKCPFELYSFEVPSSTEWNYPCTYAPNLFVDISDVIHKKIKALEVYKTEVRKFPHPRSREAIENIAIRWGSVSGLGCAEAFEVIRIIR